MYVLSRQIFGVIAGAPGGPCALPGCAEPLVEARLGSFVLTSFCRQAGIRARCLMPADSIFTRRSQPVSAFIVPIVNSPYGTLDRLVIGFPEGSGPLCPYCQLFVKFSMGILTPMRLAASIASG